MKKWVIVSIVVFIVLLVITSIILGIHVSNVTYTSPDTVDSPPLILIPPEPEPEPPIPELKPEPSIPEQEPIPEPSILKSQSSSTFGKAIGDYGEFLPFNFDCGDNYIISLHGTSGQYLDSIGVKCSDGTVFSPVGGSTGSSYNIQQLNGIHNVGIRSGNIIDAINVDQQTVGGPGGSLSQIDCPQGPLSSITGLASNTVVGSLSMQCKDSPLPPPLSLTMRIMGRTGSEKVRFFIVNDQGFKSDLLDKELQLTKEVFKMKYLIPANTVEFIIEFLDMGSNDVVLYTLNLNDIDIKTKLYHSPVTGEKMEIARKGYLNWKGSYHYTI